MLGAPSGALNSGRAGAGGGVLSELSGFLGRAIGPLSPLGPPASGACWSGCCAAGCCGAAGCWLWLCACPCTATATINGAINKIASENPPIFRLFECALVIATSCAPQHNRFASLPRTPTLPVSNSANPASSAYSAVSPANSAPLPYSNRRGNSPEGNQRRPRLRPPGRHGAGSNFARPLAGPIATGLRDTVTRLIAARQRPPNQSGLLSPQPDSPGNDRNCLDRLSRLHAGTHAGRDSWSPSRRTRPRPGPYPRSTSRRQARIHRRRRRHERQPRLTSTASWPARFLTASANSRKNPSPESRPSSKCSKSAISRSQTRESTRKPLLPLPAHHSKQATLSRTRIPFLPAP